MSLELLVATAIGLMTAAGVRLALERRTFPVVLGMTFLSYAVNLFLFVMGRITVGAPPMIRASKATTTIAASGRV